MAAASQKFDAKVNDHLNISNDTIEVPDDCPEAFETLLRYASGHSLQLTEVTVWDVLEAADKYQVLPLVRRCFHFLLHEHSAREDGEHVCRVMELAHRLHQPEYRQMSFNLAKSRAGDILSSKPCLRTLCYDCMLAFVRANDLAGVDETLVTEAVFVWTLSACAQRGKTSAKPSWKEFLSTAGELMHLVRYLATPGSTPMSLPEGRRSSCHLTKAEMYDLLGHDESPLSCHVQCRRWAKVGPNCKESESPWWKCARFLLEMLLYAFVVLVVVLVFMFMLKTN